MRTLAMMAVLALGACHPLTVEELLNFPPGSGDPRFVIERSAASHVENTNSTRQE